MHRQRFWKKQPYCISLVIVFSCWLTGCAARMETTAGNTWIVGFARVRTDARELGKGRFVSVKSEQAAPFEFGVEPYGIFAGIGCNGNSMGLVGPELATDEFRSRRTFGISLGKGEMPWRWGVTHFKMPRPGERTLIRVNTVRGLDLRMRVNDPLARVGYSRTTLMLGEATNAFTVVKFQTAKIVPLFEVSEEKPGE